MNGVAFCPAHITGFFKAEITETEHAAPELLGSTGAGFSIKEGVTTRIRISQKNNQETNFKIISKGYQSDKTDVSEFVLKEFLKLGDFNNLFFDVVHEISVPVGYGLGSSGAVSLSMAFALDQALGTNLEKVRIGQIAHNAEISCKTGLGDVLASYHGGFEIRIKPGAPGIGQIEKINSKLDSVVMICFAPISTNKFIRERLSQINGLGGKMVKKLLETRDPNHFQDMSLEFARYVNVMTPRMEKVIEELLSKKIKCGVALFGETIFAILSKNDEKNALEVFSKYPDGIIIKSGLDHQGVRLLN